MMQVLATFRREVADVLGLPVNPGQWLTFWNRQMVLATQSVLAHAPPMTLEALAFMLADPNVGKPTTRHRFHACAFSAL